MQWTIRYKPRLTHLIRASVFAGLAWLTAGCASSPGSQPPEPLPERSTPYALDKQWQLQLDAFVPAQAEGLHWALAPEHVFFATPSGHVTKAKRAPQARWVDQIVWQKKLGASVSAGPTLREGQVVIGTTKGQLISYDATSAETLWSTRLSSEVLSRPVMSDSQLFVRTVDGKLYAINPENGQTNWVIERNLPNLSLRGLAPVTYHQGRVYIGWENGKIEALDARTGNQLWERQFILPSGRTDLERLVDIQARLLIQDQRLFALGYQGKLAALNPETGRLYWSQPLSGYRSMQLDAQGLYVITADDALHALDPVNGTQLWTQTLLKGRSLSDVFLYGHNQLLVADRYGHLHWFDRVDGSVVARNQISRPGMGEAIIKLWVDAPSVMTLDADGFVKAYQVQPSDWLEFHHPERIDPLFSPKAPDASKP